MRKAKLGECTSEITDDGAMYFVTIIRGDKKIRVGFEKKTPVNNEECIVVTRMGDVIVDQKFLAMQPVTIN